MAGGRPGDHPLSAVTLATDLRRRPDAAVRPRPLQERDRAAARRAHAEPAAEDSTFLLDREPGVSWPAHLHLLQRRRHGAQVPAATGSAGRSEDRLRHQNRDRPLMTPERGDRTAVDSLGGQMLQPPGGPR